MKTGPALRFVEFEYNLRKTGSIRVHYTNRVLSAKSSQTVDSILINDQLANDQLTLNDEIVFKKIEAIKNCVQKKTK